MSAEARQSPRRTRAAIAGPARSQRGLALRHTSAETGVAFSDALSSLPKVREVLEGCFASDRCAARGAQLWVAHNANPIVDQAVGAALDGRMTVRHLHAVYCLSKPVAALAVGAMIDRRLLDLDTPVRDLVGDRPYVCGSPSVGQVLNHSAGLARPLAVEWRMCPPRDRPKLLSRTNNSSTAAYSELAGGLIIESVIERLTGQRADQWVTRTLLEPYGLANDFIVDAERLDARSVASRIRVPFGGPRRLPLLSELLPSQRRECRLAFGAVASARGIGGVFDLWRRSLVDDDGPISSTAARQMVSCRRGRVEDPVIRRTADFAAGLAVDLGDHELGVSRSAQTIGHAAGMAIAAGRSDPDRGLTLGIYLNGSMLDDPRASCRLRHSLINAILHDSVP